MTSAQWLFEYHALKNKEMAEVEAQVEIMKASADILRRTLVGVFGLNLFSEEKDPDVFTPGAFVFGNHHLLKPLLDRAKKTADDKAAAEAAVSDAAFEEFSKRLARGDVGDMEPILNPDLKNAYWNSLETQQTLMSLGIKPRPADAPAAPHYGKKKGTVQWLDEDGVSQGGLELEPGLIVGGDE